MKKYIAEILATGKVETVNGKRTCPKCTKIIKNIGYNTAEVNPVFLIKKTNKKTKDWFYGCPNFPKCKHSENRPLSRIEQDLKTWSWANSLYPPNHI